MESKDLYRYLLCLSEPWTVDTVFSQEHRAEIKAIRLDKWPAYIKAQEPQTEKKMVFDIFHMQ